MICMSRDSSCGAPSFTVDRRQLVFALDVPRGAAGMVLLVQARGSVRPGLLGHGFVPVFRSTGLATCVVDLVEANEAKDLRKVADIDFLADRLTGVMEFLALDRATGRLPLAILGRESAAAAAIRLAAEQPDRVRAAVSCSGRPDLAGIDVATYRVPTLLLVSGVDGALVRANQAFFLRLRDESQLAVIRGGGRLGESGALAACQKVIHSWCVRYLGIPGGTPRKVIRRHVRTAFKGALVRG